MKNEKDESVGLGGRQQAAAATAEKISITHFNIAIEVLTECEQELMARMQEFFEREGVTFKEVGGGPTRFNGKRCPKCNALIHFFAVDCGHCRAKF